MNHIYLNLNRGRDSKMKLTRLVEGNQENNNVNNRTSKRIMEKEFIKNLISKFLMQKKKFLITLVILKMHQRI